jgi:small subunit ribosomal protein S6
MALYENVFIARQDIAASQVDALIERYEGVIAANGGKVTKKENWGLRSLAYRMNKNRKGHYVLFNIDAPAKAVMEMERQMRFDEDVIRYMSVRVEELEDGPSAMMSYKGKDAKGRAKKFDDKFDIEDESEEF